MNKRFRFGVDILLPIFLVLWTLWPVIFLVIGGLLQTSFDPGKATGASVNTAINLWGVSFNWLANSPGQVPAYLMLTLPTGFIGLSFYWACHRKDRKPKRLKFAWLVCLPCGILFWVLSPIIIALIGGGADSFYPNQVSGDGEVGHISILGVNLSDFLTSCAVLPWGMFLTLPTGGIALGIWLVCVLVWQGCHHSPNKRAEGT